MNDILTILSLLIIIVVFAAMTVLVYRRRKKAGDINNIRKVREINYDWQAVWMNSDGNCLNRAFVCVNSSSFTIGSSPEADFRLMSRKVGRIHAQVNKKGRLYYLVDCHSKNGTYHNGKKIETINLQDELILWLADCPVIFIDAKMPPTDEHLHNLLSEALNSSYAPEL